MIKWEIDRDSDKQMIQTEGTMATILTDITFRINQVYNAFLRHNDDAAEDFKKAMTVSILSGLPFVRTHPGEGEGMTEVFYETKK